MKKFIKIALVALLLLTVTVSAFACKTKDEYVSFTMKTGTDGTFKILQLTDIHLINSDRTSEYTELDFSLRDQWAMEAVRNVIDAAHPDMIMVTGDSVYNLDEVASSRPGLNTDNETSFKKFADFIDSFKIPWAFCFGNHDEEGDLKVQCKEDKTAAKKALSAYLTSKNIKYCMYTDGPDDINGVGNYIINVLNGDGSVNNALVVFDSGSYIGRNNQWYECVHDDQLEWYEKAIKHIASLNHTENVSSIVFQHIPFREYREVLEIFQNALKQKGISWTNVIKADGTGEPYTVDISGETITYHGGVYNEGEICCSYEGYWAGAHYDGGHEFQKLLDLGSTKAVFCGHDHRNTFSFTYQGIRLTYGMSIDYSANGLTPIGDNQTIYSDIVQRGGTLITLNADSSIDVKQVPYSTDLYQMEMDRRGQTD